MGIRASRDRGISPLAKSKLGAADVLAKKDVDKAIADRAA